MVAYRILVFVHRAALVLFLARFQFLARIFLCCWGFRWSWLRGRLGLLGSVKIVFIINIHCNMAPKIISLKIKCCL